jgi:hypothetical protein
VTAPVKRRIAAIPGPPARPSDHVPPPPQAPGPDTRNGPVVVLSYAYADADRVQNALAVDAGLACTQGTGIIALCAAAAETWRRIEGRASTAMSPLAVAAVRRMVNAQVTAMLAGYGRKRWCELATASPGAAETFLQLFPHARLVCVHRACLEVVRVGVQANPWGLQGQGLAPYLLAHSGNSVAALAAYWADSAEHLIAFENAHPEVTHRVRSEDVAVHPDQALARLRATLGLDDGTKHTDTHLPQPAWLAEPDTPPAQPLAPVPTEMIPEPLRQRISRLQAELGYRSMGGLGGVVG